MSIFKPLGSNEESSDVEGENSEVEKSVPEPSTESNFLFGDGGEDETCSDLYNTGGIVNPEHYVSCWSPSQKFSFFQEFLFLLMLKISVDAKEQFCKV